MTQKMRYATPKIHTVEAGEILESLGPVALGSAAPPASPDYGLVERPKL